MKEWTVDVEANELGGYNAYCVEIPEAVSQGDTREEALAHLDEAIEMVLAYRRETKPRGERFVHRSGA